MEFMADSLGAKARDLLMTGFIPHHGFTSIVSSSQVVTDYSTLHSSIGKGIYNSQFSVSVGIPAPPIQLGFKGIYNLQLDKIVNVAATIDIPKWNTNLTLDDKGVFRASYFHHLGGSKRTILSGAITRSSGKTTFGVGLAHILGPVSVIVKAESNGVVAGYTELKLGERAKINIGGEVDLNSPTKERKYGVSVSFWW